MLHASIIPTGLPTPSTLIPRPSDESLGHSPPSLRDGIACRRVSVMRGDMACRRPVLVNWPTLERMRMTQTRCLVAVEIGRTTPSGHVP
jgi:hypothetical protein